MTTLDGTKSWRRQGTVAAHQQLAVRSPSWLTYFNYLYICTYSLVLVPFWPDNMVGIFQLPDSINPLTQLLQAFSLSLYIYLFSFLDEKFTSRIHSYERGPLSMNVKFCEVPWKWWICIIKIWSSVKMMNLYLYLYSTFNAIHIRYIWRKFAVGWNQRTLWRVCSVFCARVSFTITGIPFFFPIHF